MRQPAQAGGDYLVDLQQGASAARADERRVGVPSRSMTSGCRFGCIAAVGSDAVHARRLRVEAAHRDLAADRAGAGHAYPQERGQMEALEPGGPERGGIIAHGPGARVPAPRRRPRRLARRTPARVAIRPTPGRSLVTRPRPASTSSGPRPWVRTASPGSPADRSAVSLGTTRPRDSPASSVRAPRRHRDRARPHRRTRRADRRGRPPGRFGRPLRRPPGARAARSAAWSSTSTGCTSRRWRAAGRRPRLPVERIRPRDLADSGTDVA